MFGGNLASQEFGYAQVRVRGHSRLLREIEDRASTEGYGLLDMWMSHGDCVAPLPEGRAPPLGLPADFPD